MKLKCYQFLWLIHSALIYKKNMDDYEFSDAISYNNINTVETRYKEIWYNKIPDITN